MALDLLVATRSADKLTEIRAILSNLRHIRLLTLTDVAIAPSPVEDDVESHETFLDNAVAKASYFAHLTGLPTLADDSGLAVDALGGAPGVRTRRFAIDHGAVDAAVSGRELDLANNRLLLEKLAGLPEEERGAHYVCASAYTRGADMMVTAIGTCSGRIAHTEKGSQGFGYDPIFEIVELGITFAELSLEEKNQRSHRARAFRALAAQLR